MNKNQLLDKLTKGGFSEKIVGAFAEVEREVFIPTELKKYAYEDTALPIGHGQTISQPYTIAFMLKLLDINGEQKILEVGSGSGYVLALLHAMNPANNIFGTEIIKDLYKLSVGRLKDYNNIQVFEARKKLGLPEQSFNRILVSASAQEIPDDLLGQLNNDGVMVCPVKDSIIKVTKKADKIKTEEFPGFLFVPLII